MIPFIHKPFEALSRNLGPSPDELKVIFSFLLSYPLAGLLKRIPDSKPEQKNYFIIGVSIFYLVGLFDLWDGVRTLLISSCGAYAIASFLRTSRYMPWIAFAFLMGHMSVSHIARQIAASPSRVDITGAQMVLVMKLSAFCWNVADGALPSDQLTESQLDRALVSLPSLLDFAGYVLFFPSLFAGPAFDYAEYRRWIDTSMFDLPAKVDPAKKPPVRKKRRIPRSGTPATIRAIKGLAWIGLFVAMGPRFDHTRLVQDSYLELGFLRRITVMYLVNFTARLKYYGVWYLTEGACILTGLGYNGVDPVTGRVSWDRLRNVDPWMVESAQNARAFLGGWNQNTNNWLRNYVYLRVTPRGKKPGFRASMTTFVTSAFWHGFHPGYYLAFVLASLIQTAAKNFRRLVRPYFLDPITGQATPNKRYYDIITFLGTQLTFSFTTTPFLLLSFSGSLKAWNAVYMYAFVWVVASLIFFASPGKVTLRKNLNKRAKHATGHISGGQKMTRTTSTESITGKDPILGISKDPEQDINEAMQEFMGDTDAQHKKHE